MMAPMRSLKHWKGFLPSILVLAGMVIGPFNGKAQVLTNEWSQLISKEVPAGAHRGSNVLLEWDKPTGYEFRTRELGANIVLKIDVHHQRALPSMDVKAKLQVRARL